MGNTVSSPSGQSPVYDRQTFPRSEKKLVARPNTIGRTDNRNTHTNGNQESSRMLFLMYLIHRTWNVVVDGKGGKRDEELNKTRFLAGGEENEDDYSCVYGSECSYCSCGYCEDENCLRNGNYSICESQLSYCFYEMAPSAAQTEHQPSNAANDPWNQQNGKENLRPPVFFPEDYISALKKFSKFGSSSGSHKSIYDTIDETKTEKSAVIANKSRTLPLSKSSDYKSPIASADAEMTLKQFGSITELLMKLRADLRQSFHSFVEEFIASPMDGVSLLLEVLRAIQLSQNTITGSSTLNSQNMEMRNNQSYQRRAQLDELTCLQCLSICCSRSNDAASRLGTTPVGLLPLACSSTGTGIRARILALQLLTMACDKNALGDCCIPKASQNGHQAVSESLSTLRLRCAEPVRFRLLIGILNSGGGSGELQFAGMRFINTLMESAETLQTRLYLQAELSQAGFEPQQMSKLISSTSPWMQRLLDEVKRWELTRIDIERLQKEVRSAEQCRSKMVILERKVEMLQEEKNVFTSIERRLQEKCAELQRELMQMRKSGSTASTLEKRPVALPRQTIAGNTLKKNSSENEDEGISSSETGQSSSPVPPLDYPATHKSDNANKLNRKDSFDDSNTTIDDVIEELTNIVNDVEREISENQRNVNKPSSKPKSEDLQASTGIESEIIVNLLPQPPKKANKSLIHIFGPQHDAEGSDYDLYYVENNPQQAPKESIYENDYELENKDDKFYLEHHQSQLNRPDIISTTQQCVNRSNRQKDDNNRQLLNVIMDAREKEQQMANMNRARSLERDVFPSQQFSGGVFFMSDMMNHTSKFSKPDIMAAIEAKRGSKNFGVDSMIDVVMTTEQQKTFHSSKTRQIFLPAIDKFSPPQNVAFNNFKFKNTNVNPSLFDQRDNRAQSNNGSKVTDLISGLY